MTPDAAMVLLGAAVAATLLVIFWRVVLAVVVTGGLAVFLVGALRLVELARSLR